MPVASLGFFPVMLIVFGSVGSFCSAVAVCILALRAREP